METLFGDHNAPQAEELDESAERSALPLGSAKESLREEESRQEEPLAFPVDPTETSRALALTDVIAPRTRPGEALIRMAYRMGVPGIRFVGTIPPRIGDADFGDGRQPQHGRPCGWHGFARRTFSGSRRQTTNRSARF